MTREENLHWIDQEIQTWENECQSKHPIKEALYAARRALAQESVSLEVYKQVAFERDIAIKQLHELGYEFGEKIEQKPIFDKIRAEIMKLDDINPNYPMDRAIHLSRNEVLQIIDKYREGSEGKK